MESMPFGIERDNDLIGKIRSVALAGADFGGASKQDAEDIFFSVLLLNYHEDFSSHLPYSPSEYFMDKMPRNMRLWYLKKYQGGLDECPDCGGYDRFDKLDDGRYYCAECEEYF